MSQFSEKITGKIQKEDIHPIPHWEFVLKYSIFWGLFLIAAILGAVAFCLFTYIFFETDYEAFLRFPRSELFIIIIRPLIFWIISFGVFLLVAFFGIRHTRKGYRIPPLYFIFGNVIVSILLGTLLYGIDGAERFDEFVADTVPLYHSMHMRRINLWSQPEVGLLSGEVQEKNDNTLTLEDFFEKKWKVDISAASGINLLISTNGQNIMIQRRIIKVLGRQTSDNEFFAEEILPWRRSNPDFQNDQMQKMIQIQIEMHLR
ncbi:hypothetical protein HZA38_00330 [Candidatus Peregrinibacteria bacterium]|nr:hypothetical protein [Candidatus Peregrinibacteria bacterium]